MSDWIARVGAAGVLPVVQLPDGADPIALVDALLAGGVDCIEITLRTAGAVGAIEAIRGSGRDVLVAAGTVLTIDQAAEAVDHGAQLLVAPGYSAPVVMWATGHGVPILPGASTPTEIQMGMDDGVATFSSSRRRPPEGRRTWRRWRGRIRLSCSCRPAGSMPRTSSATSHSRCPRLRRELDGGPGGCGTPATSLGSGR